MKKLLLFVLLLITGWSSGLLAQGIGLRAGFNLSAIEGDDVEGFDMKPGYHFGVFYQRPVSDKVMVEPALLFATRGAQNESKETYEISNTATFTEKYKTEVITHYLEVPVTLKYFLDPKLHISLTPSISFLLSDKIEFTSIECINESCTGIREEEDDYDEFQSVDLGVGFGLGYNITDHLSIITNYQLGLISIIEETEAFNRILSFSLGYRF